MEKFKEIFDKYNLSEEEQISVINKLSKVDMGDHIPFEELSKAMFKVLKIGKLDSLSFEEILSHIN